MATRKVPGVLARLTNIGRGVEEYSLDTINMFRNEADAAGFTVDVSGLQSDARAR